MKFKKLAKRNHGLQKKYQQVCTSVLKEVETGSILPEPPDPEHSLLGKLIPKDTVVVASFHNPLEAHLCKGILEKEGILCFLYDESIALLVPGFSVRLMVPKAEYDKAMKLLKEYQN